MATISMERLLSDEITEYTLFYLTHGELPTTLLSDSTVMDYVRKRIRHEITKYRQDNGKIAGFHPRVDGYDPVVESAGTRWIFSHRKEILDGLRGKNPSVWNTEEKVIDSVVYTETDSMDLEDDEIAFDDSEQATLYEGPIDLNELRQLQATFREKGFDLFWTVSPIMETK